MALDFPSTPTDGQTYTSAGVTWTWSAATGAWLGGTPGARQVVATIGDGTATSFVVTHNLNTRDVGAYVYDTGTLANAVPQIVHTSVNTITLNFSSPPTAGQYRVVVNG